MAETNTTSDHHCGTDPTLSLRFSISHTDNRVLGTILKEIQWKALFTLQPVVLKFKLSHQILSGLEYFLVLHVNTSRMHASDKMETGSQRCGVFASRKTQWGEKDEHIQIKPLFQCPSVRTIQCSQRSVLKNVISVVAPYWAISSFITWGKSWCTES